MARSAPIRSAGKALKKESTKGAVETALEALECQPVGGKAKQRLKSATCGILLNPARQARYQQRVSGSKFKQKEENPVNRSF